MRSSTAVQTPLYTTILFVLLATLQRPTVDGQVFEPCNFCRAPNVVTNPSGTVSTFVLNVLNLDGVLTCSQLDAIGQRGLLSDRICLILQSRAILRRTCGCSQLGVPVPVPVPVPIPVPIPLLSSPPSYGDVTAKKKSKKNKNVDVGGGDGSVNSKVGKGGANKKQAVDQQFSAAGYDEGATTIQYSEASTSSSNTQRPKSKYSKSSKR